MKDDGGESQQRYHSVLSQKKVVFGYEQFFISRAVTYSVSLQPESIVLSLSKHQSLMRAAMGQLNLSARAYRRILKLSFTTADLTGSEEIQTAHLAEALQYRPKIMMG